EDGHRMAELAALPGRIVRTPATQIALDKAVEPSKRANPGIRQTIPAAIKVPFRLSRELFPAIRLRFTSRLICSRRLTPCVSPARPPGRRSDNSNLDAA